MTDIGARLEARLGADRVWTTAEALEALRRDICRFELGQPRIAVAPTTEAELGVILAAASEARIPVVPYGKRSAYWRPIDFRGALALSVDGLSGIQSVTGNTMWLGAGTSVREVHDACLERGSTLVCHPDAYGDTSIGSMVATGFKSGCGMGAFDLADLVTSVRVAGMDGRVHEPGAAGVLKDVSHELFFGSSGALGVIAAVAIRMHPRCPRALLRFSPEAKTGPIHNLIELSQSLGERGTYETLRAVRGEHGAVGDHWDVDLVVRAQKGEAELEARIALAGSEIRRRFPGVTVEILQEPAEGPETIPRWWGDGDEHWEGAGREWYSAVDFNVGPDDAAECLAVLNRGWDEAESAGAASRRLGLYMAPGFLNMGLHMMFPRGNRDRFDATHPVALELMHALQKLPIRPYGSRGRAWPQDERMETSPTGLKRVQVKAMLDPDGLLHPGAIL